jgi:phage shock protein C
MFCANCGHEFAPNSNFCSACGASAIRAAQATRIVRPRHPRMIAGVCSGIAIHYGWDITLLRIIVVITTILTGGFMLIAYLAAWLVIPDALYALPPQSRPISQ